MTHGLPLKARERRRETMDEDCIKKVDVLRILAEIERETENHDVEQAIFEIWQRIKEAE